MAIEDVRFSRLSSPVLLGCVLLVGCDSSDALCPAPSLTADPQELPDGVSQTRVTVDVGEFNGFETVTKLRAVTSGTFEDEFARETMYRCAYDVSEPVEICVDVTYSEEQSEPSSEVDGVAAAVEAIRRPHAFLPNPLECAETKCIEVTCPSSGNQCPEIVSVTAEPTELEEGESATISVHATDPDGGDENLTTTITARHGTVSDPTASTTHYTCDPEVGGVIEICATATDGDSLCEVEECTSVLCPGDPLENTCPIVSSVTANPINIPSGESDTHVSVVASDPDEFPVPLRIEWTSDAGVFDDRFAADTRFSCGRPGPIRVCARANDGDPSCSVTSPPTCVTVQCPGDIVANLCPELFVINSIPRSIPAGQSSTRVETRGQDTDGVPMPLTLTLNTLWGSFENTDNIQEPLNVVAQNATYVCDRPGLVEVCVDATDGACTKTLCDTIICPDDVPTPP